MDYEQNRRDRMAADPEYAARRKSQKRAANLKDRQSGKAAARRVARALAGKTYITGELCSRGHVGPRYTANQTCVACTKMQQPDAEKKRAERMKTDPEFYARRRAGKNATASKWRKTHRAEKNAEWNEWRCKKAHRTPAWANLDAIKLVYQVAEQRTRLSGVTHVVDHFYPLNGETVSGLHVPLNLRVITEQENLRKGAKAPL